ncbi:MAG: histidinol dehydrogenase [Bacillota bacterium]
MLNTLDYTSFMKVEQDAAFIDEGTLKQVRTIIDGVRKDKDKALIRYTKMYDNAELTTLRIKQSTIDEAYTKSDETLINDLKIAYQSIETYHKNQIEEGYMSTGNKDQITGQKVTPIGRVGIYVPGGKAAYPSTVLMNAIPARVAGVKELVMITPPSPDGSVNQTILAAAKLCGINEVYRVGGAQGIAALAYGTESIPAVNKIVGPGNKYVAAAKKEVYGFVGIDMIAGPSEICIYASVDANPNYIASDLLSQAEHDESARVFFITQSESLLAKVNQALNAQLATLSRKTIARTSLSENSLAILVNTDQEAINVINKIAPEHLELMTPNNDMLVENITNAGAIFLGNYSPEALGDYYAGPNHTLPTNTSARFSSPLGVYDFIKRTSIINYTKQGLEDVKDSIINIAEKEGLTAHAEAIRKRFES